MSRYTGESQRFLAQLPYGKTTAARDAFRAADADTVDRDARSLAPQVVTSRRRASGVVVGDGRYRQVDRRPRPRKGPTWVNLTKACVERLSSMWT